MYSSEPPLFVVMGQDRKEICSRICRENTSLISQMLSLFQGQPRTDCLNRICEILKQVNEHIVELHIESVARARYLSLICGLPESEALINHCNKECRVICIKTNDKIQKLFSAKDEDESVTICKELVDLLHSDPTVDKLEETLSNLRQFVYSSDLTILSDS